MLNESSSNFNTINNPVIIQDIVMIGNRPPPPTGEFNKDKAERNQLKRILNSIELLITPIANLHQRNNYENNVLKPEKENNITRLITNEFSFYTKTPISLKGFATLQRNIATLASKQPENLHLVLSSFAVRTPDDKIMNVVAHITCGPDPKINFILKNNPSSIDPVYTIKQKKILKVLPNVDIKNEGENTVKIVNEFCKKNKLKINGNPIQFDFNNVIECKTTGNAKFNTCIEICYDHECAVAKDNFNAKWENATKSAIKEGKELEFPLQCSHIITSNCVSINTSNILGIVTHADPFYSPLYCKTGAKKSKPNAVNNLPFGLGQNLIITEPVVCSKLCEEAIITLKWKNILSNLNIKEKFIKEKYKGTQTQKSIFSQYFKFQHYHRSSQITLLETSFINALKTMTQLQQDITKDPIKNYDGYQKNLLSVLQELETAIQTVDKQMIKAGHTRTTSRMGKVLDDLTLEVEKMKLIISMPKKTEHPSIS